MDYHADHVRLTRMRTLPCSWANRVASINFFSLYISPSQTLEWGSTSRYQRIKENLFNTIQKEILDDKDLSPGHNPPLQLSTPLQVTCHNLAVLLWVGRLLSTNLLDLHHIKDIFNSMNLYCKYFRDRFVTAKYFRGNSPNHCWFTTKVQTCP